MQYSYDLSAMASFIERLTAQITAIDDHSSSVGSAARTVLAGYSGSAAEQFDKTHSTWQADMQSRVEQLKALRAHVETCKKNYEEADRVISKMFGP